MVSTQGKLCWLGTDRGGFWINKIGLTLSLSNLDCRWIQLFASVIYFVSVS